MAADTDIGLRTAVLTSAFCSAIAVLYGLVGAEPSQIVSLYVTSAPALAAFLWLDHDARRAGIPMLDWGLFLWSAWPVLLPWYAFRTRGRRGWRLLIGLLVLIGAPYLTAAATALVAQARV